MFSTPVGNPEERHFLHWYYPYMLSCYLVSHMVKIPVCNQDDARYRKPIKRGWVHCRYRWYTERGCWVVWEMRMFKGCYKQRYKYIYWLAKNNGHMTGAQLGEESGSLPCPSLKIKKSPNFRKKGPNCALPWVKFSIQNVAWSREKNAKIFPCGAFFSWLFDQMFIKVP